jgi:hypothetical protein
MDDPKTEHGRTFPFVNEVKEFLRVRSPLLKEGTSESWAVDYRSYDELLLHNVSR